MALNWNLTVSSDSDPHFATLSSAIRAMTRERADQLRARPGRKSRKPECLVIGHAWSPDEREGWLICVACEAVQRH